VCRLDSFEFGNNYSVGEEGCFCLWHDEFFEKEGMMAVLQGHISHFVDAFNLDGFLQEPVLLFGFHDCLYYKRSIQGEARWRLVRWLGLQIMKRRGKVIPRYVKNIPPEFRVNNLSEVITNHGCRDIHTMDYFDRRAEIIHDMNLPIDEGLANFFCTIFDIGSLEHVFDTKQCLSNLFRMLKINGHLLLTTPCKGHFNHGLHTFSPECILQAIVLNGFKIRYLRYSTTEDGLELERPDISPNALLWVVAKKEKEMLHFVNPQQGRWSSIYQAM
jgi:SAM-dependent methyltransferase